MDTNWNTNFSSTFENQAQPWISQSVLHQVRGSGSVLESACHEDSETVPDLWIGWGVDWDIQGWRQGSICEESVKCWREVNFWNGSQCL